MTAEEIEVGDWLHHYSPKRGRVPEKWTWVLVTNVTRVKNTILIDGSPFGTARHAKEGVVVRRPDRS
jgi:hypothetical protein